MALHGTDIADCWTLTPADRALVMAKSGANRVEFALLLLFYRAHGRFPHKPGEIEPGAVGEVVQQLGMAGVSHDGLNKADRTWKRHRAEIRALFGYREATVANADMLSDWLRDQVAVAGGVHRHLAALLDARCRELLIEPPSDDRAERIVHAAIYAHDERFCTTILGRVTPTMRATLEALLRPAGSKDEEDPEVKEAAGTAPAVLLQLRGDPGRPSFASVQDELDKLELIRRLELPEDLFDHVLPQELVRYRQPKRLMNCAGIQRQRG